MSNQKNFHILKLEASNIKGIKAVIIEPESGIISIEGKNGNGKTSALDAIEMALRGQKYCPSKPIREGEEKGEIILTLGDHISKDVDFVVKRTFTEKGSYLKVTNSDGLEYKTAQGMLDALCGAMAFDPMEFTRMDSKKRIETLKKLAGLDFDEIDKTASKVFNDRSDVNRSLKELEAQIKEYDDAEDVEAPDISEIQKQRSEAESYNQQVLKSKNDLERHLLSHESEKKEIEDIEQKLIMLKEKTAKRQDEINRLKDVSFELRSLEEFDLKIKEFANLTKKASEYKQKLLIQSKINDKKHLSEDMTRKLSDLKEEKEKMLEGANLPVAGLDFSDGDVTFDGIDFEQVNMAKKIEISMCMAIALNPRLRIVRIMNGSLIDSEGMKAIEKIARENDFDVWIERVSEEKTSSNSFLISEGVLSE